VGEGRCRSCAETRKSHCPSERRLSRRSPDATTVRFRQAKLQWPGLRSQLEHTPLANANRFRNPFALHPGLPQRLEAARKNKKAATVFGQRMAANCAATGALLNRLETAFCL